jgi:hypothetical protein
LCGLVLFFRHAANLQFFASILQDAAVECFDTFHDRDSAHVKR